MKLLFKADFPDAEWTSAPIRFVGKHAAGTPAARDLLMDRQDGEVLVWNKYWAFGGGEPDDSEITNISKEKGNCENRFKYFRGA